MRNLVYKCYFGKILIKVVTTLKEANEWKAENIKNTFEMDVVNVKDETEKEREKRLERIAKRKEYFKKKRALV